ncbi:hypothetical protein ABK040_010567 [Willaertia magna]
MSCLVKLKRSKSVLAKRNTKEKVKAETVREHYNNLFPPAPSKKELIKENKRLKEDNELLLHKIEELKATIERNKRVFERKLQRNITLQQQQ